MNTIDTAKITLFKKSIDLQVQQERSMLQNTVTIDRFQAYERRYTKQDSGEFSARGARNPNATATPTKEWTYKYRWLRTSDYDLSGQWDRNDEFIIADMANPKGVTVRSFAAAYARREDLTIIAAMDGAAPSGADGSSTTALPTAQQVAVNFVESGSALNSGLTLAKIRETNRIFSANEIDPMKTKYWVIGPAQVRDLQQINEYNSIDYNERKGLMYGHPVQFMGFSFILSNRLTATSGVRDTFAYCPEAIVFNPGYGLEIRFDELPTSRYDRQLYAMVKHGAMRYYDEMVVQVFCDES